MNIREIIESHNHSYNYQVMSSYNTLAAGGFNGSCPLNHGNCLWLGRNVRYYTGGTTGGNTGTNGTGLNVRDLQHTHSYTKYSITQNYVVTGMQKACPVPHATCQWNAPFYGLVIVGHSSSSETSGNIYTTSGSLRIRSAGSLSHSHYLTGYSVTLNSRAISQNPIIINCSAPQNHSSCLFVHISSGTAHYGTVQDGYPDYENC
jgi:hypothetical protein